MHFQWEYVCVALTRNISATVRDRWVVSMDHVCD